MTPPLEPEEKGGPGLEPALEELRARLAADLAALMAVVEGLSQAQADWRPTPDRWSIGEVLHHLVLSNRSFALVAGKLVERGRCAGPAARQDGRRSWPRLRTVADIKASGPVKNPDRVTPAQGLPIQQLRSELVEAHRAVEGHIPALAALELETLQFPHPLGFQLNLYQWTDIAGAHERRHLRQIEAVIAAEGFPRTRP